MSEDLTQFGPVGTLLTGLVALAFLVLTSLNKWRDGSLDDLRSDVSTEKATNASLTSEIAGLRRDLADRDADHQREVSDLRRQIADVETRITTQFQQLIRDRDAEHARELAACRADHRAELAKLRAETRRAEDAHERELAVVFQLRQQVIQLGGIPLTFPDDWQPGDAVPRPRDPEE